MKTDKKIKFKFFEKDKIFSTISLLLALVVGIVLLISGIIKGAFVLSKETAIVEAKVSDIVLGTASIALILFGLALTLLGFFLMYRGGNKIFTNSVILGACIVFILSVLCIIFRGHEVYNGDWKDLNDVASAKGLVTATKQVTPEQANQAIQSKADLVALKFVKDAGFKYGDLIVAKLNNQLGNFLDAHKDMSAQDWFAADVKDVNSMAHVLTTNTLNMETINGFKDVIGKPIVFTGLTNTYMQLYPLDLTFMILSAVAIIPTLLAIILSQTIWKNK